MKSKIIKAIVSCIVIIGIGFGGYFVYKTYFTQKTVTTTTRYYSVSATKMDLQESIQGTGSVYAATTKDVSPNNNGTLKSLSVKVGDTVKKGQTLFVSSSDDIKSAVTTAKNNLAKANLTLSSDESTQVVDDNKVASDKIAVSDAKAQLSNANAQYSKMTVEAPIGGVVTAVNNSNGDNVQSGNAVLTIIDMSSMKIKVSVDELDIEKIKVGQKAEIKFDALEDKIYEGSVENIALTGTTSNNVTTYDVVVDIADPTGIKLGMNANVTIVVENKADALVIPAEALIENNGETFVRVEGTDASNPASVSVNTQSQSGNTQGANQANRNNRVQSASNSSKLVAIKTGLETENYIEITEGLTEGQKVLVQLPETSSSNTNKSRNSMNMGGFGGDMGGGPMGGDMGGLPSQGQGAAKN